MPETVNGLWIKGKLSSLELLTIESFISNGFIFCLWTYDKAFIHVSDKVILKDANEILSFEQVFCYQFQNINGHGKGSYAGFSDIFRYKLLYEKGGIWTDMDITCLKSFKIKGDYFFRYHHKSGAVGNFMKCPRNSKLMKWCYEKAIIEVTKYNKNWMLPIQILNEGIKEHKLSNYIYKNSNNDSFPEVSKFLNKNHEIPDSWQLFHWMNEEFRRLKVDKHQCIEHSLLNKYYNLYGIKHETLKGVQKFIYLLNISRINYLWQHIKAIFYWYLKYHQRG